MQAESDAAPLRVLFEDEYLLALDKPAGIVVHPTYRNQDRTLLNALLWHARDWTNGQRPALVGRLDKDTTGVVLVSKDSRAHAALQRATAADAAAKEYLAIVYGRVKAARGSIDLALGPDPADRRRMIGNQAGSPSLTKFERLASVPAPRVGLALLRCTLGSGRRHQIRAHLAERKWPIVGDPVYGEPRWEAVADTQLAENCESSHAKRFTHTAFPLFTPSRPDQWSLSRRRRRILPIFCASPACRVVCQKRTRTSGAAPGTLRQVAHKVLEYSLNKWVRSIPEAAPLSLIPEASDAIRRPAI